MKTLGESTIPSVARTALLYVLVGFSASLGEYMANLATGRHLPTLEVAALRLLIYVPISLAVGFIQRWIEIRRQQRTAKRISDLETLLRQNQPRA